MDATTAGVVVTGTADGQIVQATLRTPMHIFIIGREVTAGAATIKVVTKIIISTDAARNNSRTVHRNTAGGETLRRGSGGRGRRDGAGVRVKPNGGRHHRSRIMMHRRCRERVVHLLPMPADRKAEVRCIRSTAPSGHAVIAGSAYFEKSFVLKFYEFSLIHPPVNCLLSYNQFRR